MGGDAATLTHPFATQDSAGVVHISRRRKQKLGKESNPGQEQTLKVPPEALAFFGSAIVHVEPSRKMSGARTND
jgi:hypothetical protein